jgi:hypothetical protein
MTSSMHQGMGQTTEGRSVRDIVEHDHALVNEAWCRKIFRQLLQSLERQYAMDMPHRAITADTVVFHENGEPLLLPSIVSDPAPEQADDLSALARLLHYAITQELMPEGPLQGRGLAGYSDSLLNAIDRCMAPDPEQRPRSIDALRDLLGVAAPAALASAPPIAEQEPEPHPDTMAPVAASGVPVAPLRASADPALALPPDSQPGQARQPRGLRPWQRWTVAGGGAAILLAIALVGIAELRDSGSFDRQVLTLPPEGAVQPQTADAGTPAVLPSPGTTPSEAAASAEPQAPSPAQPAGAAPALPLPAAMSPRAAAVPPDTAALAPAPAATTVPVPGAAPTVPQNTVNQSASYKLQIQPWGTVYVDGVDRGVSPPVKRLVLSPGRHTIRITNPNFNERTLDVDTAQGDGRIAIDFSAAE